MHKNLVRACFSRPFFSSQGRTDTKQKEPQDFFWECRVDGLLRSFSFSRDLQRDDITLPVHPKPNNCTFCSTAEPKSPLTSHQSHFCSSPCDENNYENLNYLNYNMLVVYQLLAPWNIQTATRFKRENGIGTISQHVSSRGKKNNKKVKHLGTINIQFFFSFLIFLFA